MCRLIRNRLWLAVLCCAVAVMNARADEDMKPTHKMVDPISVGSGCSSFCLDSEGKIWAACGKDVRVFSPEGKKLDTHVLSFAAEVINVSPKGEIYVAGNGRITMLDKEGKEVNTSDTPPMSDKDAVKKAEEQLKKQQEAQVQNFKNAMENTRKTLAKLEEIEEEDLTAAQKKQIMQLKNQIKSWEQSIKNMEGNAGKPINPGIMMQAKKVTGLGITDKYLFMACGSFAGGTYDVWRADHKFGDTKQIITGLRGCCGQMDIQATEEHVIVAENCKHSVSLYDHNGEKVRTFGKADRTGNSEGFSSCCNPMNTTPRSNGEILTSESGNGAIKRFSTEGKFLGLVGNAKVAAGCKRVTIAATKDMSRVFYLDFQGGKILVLEDEALAQKAEKTN